MANYTYCELEEFRRQYKENIHGYLSLAVCIFGSVANIFNICILRCRQMRSPTNNILTGLAVADLLVMLQYIPFTIHRNLQANPVYISHFSYNWAIYYQFHALFTVVLHFVACCLTVLLAIWRYNYVTEVRTNPICADQRNTNIIILLVYVVCPLVCFPMYSTLEIRTYNQTCTSNGQIVIKADKHKYNERELKTDTIYILSPNDPHFLGVWLYSVMLKLVPCILLSILSYKIIAALVETNRRKVKLLNPASPTNNSSDNGRHIQPYKSNQADRTTKMLLTVLFLFLITEFPQAILGQISAIYGETFLRECYAALGEIMDIIALINSSINFILYCTMSRQFRVTFQELFRTVTMTVFFQDGQQLRREEHAAETKMSLV